MKFTKNEFKKEYYRLWELGLLLPNPNPSRLFSVKYKKNEFDEYSRVTLKALSVNDALERACYAITYSSKWRPEDIDLHAVYDEEENLLWVDEPFYNTIQKENEFRGMERREFLALFGATSAAILFGFKPARAMAGTTTTGLSGTASGFVPTGEQLYTTAGSYNWTVPSSVTSVCVLAIDGGTAGGSNGSITVDSTNAAAFLGKASTVAAVSSWGVANDGGDGGDGGNTGSSVYHGGGGGGGGAGYAGIGGKGETGWGDSYIAATSGQGGGGGGGGRASSATGNAFGGGGTGIYGTGVNGSGGGKDQVGSGGSGGNSGSGALGGAYGGGGGGARAQSSCGGGGGGSKFTYAMFKAGGSVSDVTGAMSSGCHGAAGGCGGALKYQNSVSVTAGQTHAVVVGAGGTPISSSYTGGSGANGAVRIIWGVGRSFPSNAT